MMTDTSQLWTTRRPWLHILPEGTDPTELRSSTPIQSSLVIDFDGANMRSVDGVLGEFVREFQFPEYFGWNWAAFAECLGDLAWFPARAYLLLIRQPDLLLDESPADRETFFRIMNSVCSRWANSFALGVEFGGGEVPFNLGLMCSDSPKEDLMRIIGTYL
jgi:hypothetical protein